MKRSEKMKLPVGIENFEEIRREGFYYVDKTGMIRELLTSWGKVNLFTRPRRFGKSLNMSMLRSFLELGCDRTLFDGLEISRDKELCDQYMGKFPVISVSLKSVNGTDFRTARSLICSVIGNEAMRFYDLLDSRMLNSEEKTIYRQLITADTADSGMFVMSDAALMGSLRTLSALLQKHYGQKVIILIDEYDVPLAKANENGYYDEMISLIRNIFEQALKTNESLYFAVLTGCLRVSKESIFTGLNNPKVRSILDVQFDEYFGFTDTEVKGILEYYGISDAYHDVREWYDGYHFGSTDVYCPWDVISYCDQKLSDPDLYPESYWSNTSSNDIIRHLLEMASANTRNEIEKLIAGEFITKEIRNELTYKDIYSSIENVWSVLFMTGYLTQCGMPDRKNRSLLNLMIPNEEIRNIFVTQIQGWMQEVAREKPDDLDRFCDALKNGNAESAENILSAFLEKTISIRDTAVRNDLKETYYLGFHLGLLSDRKNWIVTSNRESGDGYTDIQVEISPEKIGIIIEIKYAQKNKLDDVCHNALKQIEEKNYAAQLLDDGMEKIYKYGVACFRKQCRIIMKYDDGS